MPGADRFPAPPQAVLFDLDDTLINVYRNPDAAWRTVVGETFPALAENERDALARAILAQVRLFLSDPLQRRAWRLDPQAIRPPVVARALAGSGDPARVPQIAAELARRYEAHRRQEMTLLSDTLDVLTRFRRAGIGLALVTNGRSDVQRHKIGHFGLARFFDHIHIEGEAGFGKPDPEAFRACLAALGVPPRGSWMVGDDLYYDIVPANALGLWTFWYADGPRRAGLEEPRRRHTRIGSMIDLVGLAAL